MVITAECDTLRDEGEAYARRLAGAGTPSELHRYEGVIHGFFAMPEVLGAARAALDEAGAFLRRSLPAMPRTSLPCSAAASTRGVCFLRATGDFLAERHAVGALQVVVLSHGLHHLADFGFQQDRRDSPEKHPGRHVPCAAERG